MFEGNCMSVAVALTFVWLGLVLGLSFMEAPLKFRAPGVTREIGLGIGRLVFKALNASEIVLAVAIILALVVDDAEAGKWIALIGLPALLGAQTVMLHGFMDKRAARIVAGEQLPPSNQHYIYIALEVVKVALLIALGTQLLKGLTS